MLSASEIRDVRFATSMTGYKKEDVDVFLDKVEADYEQFERTLHEMSNKINELKNEIDESRNAQGNIQNVLVSAQKFADQIVEEAKQKSAEIVASAQASIEKITEQEKELTNTFDKRASERKNALQKDVEAIIANAEKKQTAVENATKDCVARQQLLFNKMKMEIAAFKAEISNKYKEHLELISSIPDTVPSDPAEIAAAVSLSFNNVPTVQEYVENPQSIEVDNRIEEVGEQEIEENDVSEQVSTGFVINLEDFENDDN
ncbi:MAG: DivIVA domain-containing protein [Clostridia bacterium]|nr:DivIVA domain-containing protein [Clostridia bacterium]